MNRQALQLEAVYKRSTPQQSLNYSAGKSSCTEHTSRSILQVQTNGLLPIQDVWEALYLLLANSLYSYSTHAVKCLRSLLA